LAKKVIEERIASKEELSATVSIGSAGPNNNPATAKSSDKFIIIYSGKLKPPFEDIDLVIQTPVKLLLNGRGLAYLDATILVVILVAGLITIYRTGLSQIEFANRQHNFVAAVTHELKAPLTAIKMYGELLQSGIHQGRNKGLKFTNQILSEANRLERLVKNVLQFAELQFGKRGTKLQVEEGTAEEFLSQALSYCTPILEKSGFKLTRKREGCTAIIAAHTEGLITVVFNLVDNAVKFSQLNNNTEIEVGIVDTDTTVDIYVKDYGPGVAQKDEQLIFQPFARAESELTRKTKGSGIGLALARDLSSRMGAKLTYKRQSLGAEFRITFSKVSESSKVGADAAA
jgi:signal transduction histidine kinase